MVLMPAHSREGRSAPFVAVRAWCWYLPSHGNVRLGFFRCAVRFAFFFPCLLAIGMVSLDVKPEKHTGDLSECVAVYKNFPLVVACYFAEALNLFMFFFFLHACSD